MTSHTLKGRRKSACLTLHWMTWVSSRKVFGHSFQCKQYFILKHTVKEKPVLISLAMQLDILKKKINLGVFRYSEEYERSTIANNAEPFLCGSWNPCQSWEGWRKWKGQGESESETYVIEIYFLSITVNDRFFMKISQIQLMHFTPLMQR